MKYCFSVAIAAFLMTSAISAQHVNIGVKAGLNLYTIHNDIGASNDILPGFNAGLLGHIHLAKQLALQPEVVFSAQGAKYTVAGVDTKLKLVYVNIPILLQYMFDNGFRLEAGPQLGILASAKSNTRDVNTDFKSSLETVEFGVTAGISYVRPSTGFGIDVRYNLGLSNINKNAEVTSTNRGVQIGVFYLTVVGEHRPIRI